MASTIREHSSPTHNGAEHRGIPGEMKPQERPALVSILALPNKITSRIFVECLPSDGRVMPSPGSAPLLLAQICTQWRAVALSTRELWCSIFIAFPEQFSRREAAAAPHHGARRLLDTWVSRANGNQLSLGFSFGLNCTPDDKLPTALLSIIPPLSAQVNRLELHLTRAQFRQLRPLDAEFPLLTHLTTSPSSHLDLADLLRKTPALREVRLLEAPGIFSLAGLLEMCEDILGQAHNEMKFLPTPSTGRLPQLRSIEIRSDISMTTFLSLLAHFPLLTNLKCSIKCLTISVHPQVVYPHLQSLSLSSYQSVFALTLLTLPHLRRLELEADLDLRVLTSFLSRSRCVLDRVVIGGEDLKKEAQILKCLTVFSSVESLKIRHCLHVDRLTRCLRNLSLLPRLRDLTISAQNESVDYELLTEMLQHRMHSIEGAKLQSFRLNLARHSESDEFDSEEEDSQTEYLWRLSGKAAAGLQRLIENGLDFEMKLRSDGDDQYWPTDVTKGAALSLSLLSHDRN
ncbi:hypothetical protein DFH09DRAFT_1477073 [Mycena vulgaris]|nr:hypothetical protein DFH09DRAFT_1477073 [Mycena vulgaris]